DFFFEEIQFCKHLFMGLTPQRCLLFFYLHLTFLPRAKYNHVIKNILAVGLDRFFKSVRQSDFNIRAVTKGGLSRARSKLRNYLNFISDKFY
ncbi:MAG: hypothetical protein LBP25_05175, partial [Tannerellaceae bacterium]|nr:hypothetical protein [Tannerellaceae bacterium]